MILRMILARTALTGLVLIAAAAVFAGSAAAQSPIMPKFSLGEDKPKLTPEQQEKQDQLDSAYKAATKKIPDKKVANDPWGDVRSAPAPAAPALKKKPQQN